MLLVCAQGEGHPDGQTSTNQRLPIRKVHRIEVFTEKENISAEKVSGKSVKLKKFEVWPQAGLEEINRKRRKRTVSMGAVQRTAIVAVFPDFRENHNADTQISNDHFRTTGEQELQMIKN